MRLASYHCSTPLRESIAPIADAMLRRLTLALFAALTLALPAGAATLPPKAPNLARLLGQPARTRTMTGSGYRWFCADWRFRDAIVTACYPVAKLHAKPTATPKRSGPAA